MKRATRRWRDKFREAFDGILLGVRGQSSCAVHGIATIAVLGLAIGLRCQLWEWCVLLGCIAAVWSLELVNSAIELLFKGLSVEARDQVYPCLHIAAGAVLVASLFSALIGTLILGRRILNLAGIFES
jgi:diacylglycerol kinase